MNEVTSIKIESFLTCEPFLAKAFVLRRLKLLRSCGIGRLSVWRVNIDLGGIN
jgi:hypothetical protein